MSRTTEQKRTVEETEEANSTGVTAPVPKPVAENTTGAQAELQEAQNTSDALVQEREQVYRSDAGLVRTAQAKNAAPAHSAEQVFAPGLRVAQQHDYQAPDARVHQPGTAARRRLGTPSSDAVADPPEPDAALRDVIPASYRQLPAACWQVP